MVQLVLMHQRDDNWLMLMNLMNCVTFWLLKVLRFLMILILGLMLMKREQRCDKVNFRLEVSIVTLRRVKGERDDKDDEGVKGLDDEV